LESRLKTTFHPRPVSLTLGLYDIIFQFYSSNSEVNFSLNIKKTEEKCPDKQWWSVSFSKVFAKYRRGRGYEDSGN
jgi:hypothetical protein